MTPPAKSKDPALDEIREHIDALDAEIQQAINQRAELAQQVARAKQQTGEDSDFYRPDREVAVLRKVEERNRGPLPVEEMTRLFREIMSACLALQRPLNIAYLGPEGTFTQEAALKHFGHSVHTMAVDAIDQVFREVEAGSAHYGVVPVENSTEGVVTHTLDGFLHSPLKICGEVSLRIHHCLLSGSATLKDVKRVYSHQQSLAQCRKWLGMHLPLAERVKVSSNAEAARRAADEPNTAAVAGEVAGATYGLSPLSVNIEDEPENTTRFLIIGHRSVPPTGADKTSMLLSTLNRPGALYDLLEHFARNRVSMTRIESRPSRRENWDYVFFVDVEGHAEDPNLTVALNDIAEKAVLVKILGSYPRSVI
ncbi:MAG: prephenate dehydratase [Gammaproteobacteria bacterium]|nr:prephenate dehydratase [Gammaproteobacteria bacterium]